MTLPFFPDRLQLVVQNDSGGIHFPFVRNHPVQFFFNRLFLGRFVRFLFRGTDGTAPKLPYGFLRSFRKNSIAGGIGFVINKIICGNGTRIFLRLPVTVESGQWFSPPL